MTVRHERPWKGELNWHALRPWHHLLARRVGDRGEWVIGVAGEDASSVIPPGNSRGAFGHLAYDLKNEFEELSSQHPGHDGFPLIQWWEPRFIIRLGKGRAELNAEEADAAAGLALMEQLTARPATSGPIPTAIWTRTTSRTRYLRQVGNLLAHIQRGNIYEVNYCTQRTASFSGEFDPYTAFAKLLAHSDAPFAALYRTGDRFALCASPERFLRIEGDRVITQPIKGTRPRGRNAEEDEALAEELATDPKERSENIMAVDVARNDLSRIAAPGSVQVDELCGVKRYPNVHQLVSTVAARIHPGSGPMDVLRATFPMASMTGAPKIRAMQLIDEVEDMRRGLYSGSIGFFLPDGTADLNVVIRTLTFNSTTGRASLISGGAITAASDPEAEFAECELKARSVLQAFGHAC